MKKVVLIVEDDADQLEVLRQVVEAADSNAQIYTASNATVAYKLLMTHTVDVFMVDIILDTSSRGDTSGVRLVEKLRTIPKYMFTPVIFVTSLEDPSMYAYTDLHCISYIEKPFDTKQILRVVEQALNFTTIRDKEASLSFRKDGIWYPVKIKNIVYMEIINHIMYIHMSGGSVLDIPYVTCKQVLNDDDTDTLVQCSRSIIVNKEYVLAVDLPNQFIIFRDNYGRVDIGKTFKKKIMMEFKNGS